jgi:hypothetical protein
MSQCTPIFSCFKKGKKNWCFFLKLAPRNHSYDPKLYKPNWCVMPSLATRALANWKIKYSFSVWTIQWLSYSKLMRTCRVWKVCPWVYNSLSQRLVPVLKVFTITAHHSWSSTWQRSLSSTALSSLRLAISSGSFRQEGLTKWQDYPLPNSYYHPPSSWASRIRSTEEETTKQWGSTVCRCGGNFIGGLTVKPITVWTAVLKQKQNYVGQQPATRLDWSSLQERVSWQ